MIIQLIIILVVALALGLVTLAFLEKKKARRHRQRFVAERTTVPTSDLVKMLLVRHVSLSENDIPKLEKAWISVSQHLGVDPGKLRIDDCLDKFELAGELGPTVIDLLISLVDLESCRIRPDLGELVIRFADIELHGPDKDSEKIRCPGQNKLPKPTPDEPNPQRTNP